MTKKVFINTDVILDLALARAEFIENSKMVLAFAENYLFQGFTSSTIINTVYYILKKSGGDSKARFFIKTLLKYVVVFSVDQNDIENAIESDYSDFEDAVQNSVASRHYCDIIVTRNVNDFIKSNILINMPIELLKTFKEKI